MISSELSVDPSSMNMISYAVYSKVDLISSTSGIRFSSSSRTGTIIESCNVSILINNRT